MRCWLIVFELILRELPFPLCKIEVIPGETGVGIVSRGKLEKPTELYALTDALPARLFLVRAVSTLETGLVMAAGSKSSVFPVLIYSNLEFISSLSSSKYSGSSFNKFFV